MPRRKNFLHLQRLLQLLPLLPRMRMRISHIERHSPRMIRSQREEELRRRRTWIHSERLANHLASKWGTGAWRWRAGSGEERGEEDSFARLSLSGLRGRSGSECGGGSSSRASGGSYDNCKIFTHPSNLYKLLLILRRRLLPLQNRSIGFAFALRLTPRSRRLISIIRMFSFMFSLNLRRHLFPPPPLIRRQFFPHLRDTLRHIRLTLFLALHPPIF